MVAAVPSSRNQLSDEARSLKSLRLKTTAVLKFLPKLDFLPPGSPHIHIVDAKDAQGPPMSQLPNHIISPAMNNPKPENRPIMSSEADASPAPPANPVGRSKSRLVRLLTTKKNARSTSPPLASNNQPKPSKRPPPPNSAFSKEHREAALRERGLLPPLPQKDLSQLEWEQDRNLPVVKPTQGDPANGKGEGMSAADLIKKEWEAKNQDSEAVQRERLQTFKFGGASSSDLTKSPAEGATTSDAVPGSLQEEKRRGGHQSSLSQPVVNGVVASKDHRRSMSLQNKALPAPPPLSGYGNTPLTPVQDLQYGPEIQAYVSGASASSEKVDQFPVPSSTLKPSSSSTKSSSSNKSDGSRSSQTPKALEAEGPGNTSALETPLPTSPTQQQQDEGSIPRGDESTSSASILAPSLDSASQTISTSDSSSSGKGKSGGLRVKLDNGNPIPVIIECATEDAGEGDDAAVAILSTEEKEKEAKDQTALSPLAQEQDSEKEMPPPVPPREPHRKRGMTTGMIATKPAADQEQEQGATATSPTGPAPIRRKTINPFKRSQGTSNTTSNGPKRTFGTISRSVVGSVLRPSRFQQQQQPPEAAGGSDKDPSSPSPPHSPTKRGYWGGGGTVPPSSPIVRQAVSPTFYSTGSILAEASNIEDEEQRRMTEMAFLT